MRVSGTPLAGSFVLFCSALMAGEAPAQTEPFCQTVAFGRHCQSSTPEPSRVNGMDYGFVEIGIIQPQNTAITSANRQSWRRLIQQFFVPNVRSGQIIVRIFLEDGGQRTALATVPVALFEVDQRTGVKMVEEATLSAQPVRATPYFRLSQSRYSIYYEVEIRSSDQTTSMIVDRVRAGTQIATDFGGSGWLSTAMGTDAVFGRLQSVEQNLAALRNHTGTSTIRGYLAPHNQPNATYDFAFAPNAIPTGKLTIRFRRLASLWSDTATSTQVPAYGITTITQRTRFLDYRATNSQDVADLLQTGMTLPDWAALAASTTSPDVYASHCVSLVHVVSGLDLSEPDATGVLWAALNRGNMTRKEIRELECVKEQEAAFAALNLPMPEVAEPPPPPPPTPALEPATSATFTQNELSQYMGGLFAAMSMAPNAPGKGSLLESRFSDTVAVSEDFQAPNDMPSVSPSESSSSVARLLSAQSFSAGCFWRAADGKVTFFGRRTDATEFQGNLWTFTITLGSTQPNASISSTRITAIHIREARDADFDAARERFSGKARCHSADTAP